MTAPKTTIYLVAGAPVDMTYQHTITFKSPDEQNAFWGSLSKYELREYSYARRERRFIQVDKSFDDLDGINYLFYRTSDGSKWLYCFVTDREYVNDNSTRIFFEIDVMQTYLFDMELKPSFISQAHVDRWDANHKPIYSITEEGLNYGPEYVTESAFRIAPATGGAGSVGELADEKKHGFYLVYCTEHSALVEGGTASEPTVITGNPSPFVVYLVPSGEGIDDGVQITLVQYQLDNGDWTESPIHDLSSLQKLMKKSSLGDFIQHIVYVPYLPFDYSITPPAEGNTIDGYTLTLYGSGDIKAKFGVTSIATTDSVTRSYSFIKLRSINDIGAVELSSMPRESGIELAIPSEDMFAAIKAKPLTTEYDRRFQSKLLCYPYRYNVFTDWTGAPALIKNEYMTGDTIDVKMSIAFSFNTPRRFWLTGYRGDPEGRESGISQPIPADQPIINDAYYSYMLQNKNQISANLTNAAINAAFGTVSGAISSGASAAPIAALGAAGGPVGAVVGGILGGVASGVQGAVNVSALLRSENAKQADLKNLPDTVTNSNDSCFIIADDAKYLTFYRKKICCEYEEQLAQYWHMYGYKVNRLDVPRIKSRARFNFIKTIGANITGPIENAYLTAIKQIFDNGVTFWHYSATDFNPLDYTYENPEVSLL